MLNNKKKLLKEDIEDELLVLPEEEPIIEPVIDEIPAEEVSLEEPTEEVVQNAYSDMLQDLLQKQWEVINSCDSVIATFTDLEDLPETNKEELIAVLKSLSEETIKTVGITTKAMSLVDPKQEELMDAGEEIANAAIENAEEVPEEEPEEEIIEESAEVEKGNWIGKGEFFKQWIKDHPTPKGDTPLVAAAKAYIMEHPNDDTAEHLRWMLKGNNIKWEEPTKETPIEEGLEKETKKKIVDLIASKTNIFKKDLDLINYFTKLFGNGTLEVSNITKEEAEELEKLFATTDVVKVEDGKALYKGVRNNEEGKREKLYIYGAKVKLDDEKLTEATVMDDKLKEVEERRELRYLLKKEKVCPLDKDEMFRVQTLISKYGNIEDEVKNESVNKERDCMRVKLYEAKWLHEVPEDVASQFHKAIEEGNVELVKANSIDLLQKCKEFFKSADQQYIVFELEDLIDEFSEAEENIDEVDSLLDELYDFCDGYNILIVSDEDEEESEAEEDELELEEPELEGEEAVVLDLGESKQQTNEALFGLGLMGAWLKKKKEESGKSWDEIEKEVDALADEYCSGTDCPEETKEFTRNYFKDMVKYYRQAPNESLDESLYGLQLFAMDNWLKEKKEKSGKSWEELAQETESLAEEYRSSEEGASWGETNSEVKEAYKSDFEWLIGVHIAHQE